MITADSSLKVPENIIFNVYSNQASKFKGIQGFLYKSGNPVKEEISGLGSGGRLAVLSGFPSSLQPKKQHCLSCCYLEIWNKLFAFFVPSSVGTAKHLLFSSEGF